MASVAQGAAGVTQTNLAVGLSQLTIAGSTGPSGSPSRQTSEQLPAQGDPPSAMMADRALAALPAMSRATSSVASPGDPLGLLARWLPQGPISDVSPVAAVAEEKLRVVQSVHGLLQEYDEAFKEVLVELGRARVSAELHQVGTGQVLGFRGFTILLVTLRRGLDRAHAAGYAGGACRSAARQ